MLLVRLLGGGVLRTLELCDVKPSREISPYVYKPPPPGRKGKIKKD